MPQLGTCLMKKKDVTNKHQNINIKSLNIPFFGPVHKNLSHVTYLYYSGFGWFLLFVWLVVASMTSLSSATSKFEIDLSIHVINNLGTLPIKFRMIAFRLIVQFSLGVQVSLFARLNNSPPSLIGQLKKSIFK